MESLLRKRCHCSLEMPGALEPGLLEKLLETAMDSSDLSVCIDSSLQRLLDKRTRDSEKNQMIGRAFRLGVILQEAAKRSERTRASLHNSVNWSLPSELTLRIFSMLDMQSLSYAAATCSMFNKYAMDPMCYTNIDLVSVTSKVDNAVVCSMIKRAGKCLKSLKIGMLLDSTLQPGTICPMSYLRTRAAAASCFLQNNKRSEQRKEFCLLTRSCLTCLSMNGNAAGFLLRGLHLYHIEGINDSAFRTALVSCPFLRDLEVIGLCVELRQILKHVSANCHSVEHLLIESSSIGKDFSLKPSVCEDFVNGCPSLISLALRGFMLPDCYVCWLIQGLCKLQHVDLSTSCSFSGTFLRSLGISTVGPPLEVLILRDCVHLKAVEVLGFLSSVIAGGCGSLRFLDVSSKYGLLSVDGDQRCFNPDFPLSHILEERPGLCFMADFPSNIMCCNENENSVDGDVDSDRTMESSGSISASVSIYESRSDDSEWGVSEGASYRGFSDSDFFNS